MASQYQPGMVGLEPEQSACGRSSWKKSPWSAMRIVSKKEPAQNVDDTAYGEGAGVSSCLYRGHGRWYLAAPTQH